MSDAKDKGADAPKKKGGMMKVIMIVVGALVLLGVGGGGMFYAFSSGMLGGGEAHAKEDNKPKLIRKGEEDPYAPVAKDDGHGGGGDKGHATHGEGGQPYRLAYYAFEQDFTSNLKDSGSLVQVSIALSTPYDYRVLQWVKDHELAIRSAILIVLADTPENEVFSIEGKTRLQKRIVDAVNKVLKDTEGFGGIKEALFRSFIVQ